LALIARMVLLLAGALALAGCGAPGEPERDWPAPSPAIWELTAPGGGKGWLFGTVHALPGGLAWRTAPLDEAIGQSGLLVVEIAELGDTDLGRETFTAAAHTPGLPPLLARVPEPDRPPLRALMADAGLGDTDLADTETWAAALVIASSLRQYDPANGADRALMADAPAIEGLETYAGQFARFDGLSARAQVKLVRALSEDERSALRDARIEAWLTGDVQRLEELAGGTLLEDTELRDTLLTARNRAWAGRIAMLVEGGRRPFVAVGAGHMLWEDGLPALLAARGFTVRRRQ